MKNNEIKINTKKRNIVIAAIAITVTTCGIITGCGIYKNANAEPAKETFTEVETETTATTAEAVKETTEKTEEPTTEAVETTEKTTEEETTTEEPTTEATTEAPTTSQPTTEAPAHTHNWTTETYYTTETSVVHHEAVTHTEEQTTYTEEEVPISGFMCHCGIFWPGSIYGCDCPVCEGSGCSWVETTIEKVPHTETVTVVDKPAWDETVETQVAHTREVCSGCGATR